MCNNFCILKYSTCGSQRRINIPHTSIDYHTEYYVKKYFNSFRLTWWSWFETSYDLAGSAYRSALHVYFLETCRFSRNSAGILCHRGLLHLRLYILPIFHLPMCATYPAYLLILSDSYHHNCFS
jgi:hypothetical protein